MEIGSYDDVAVARISPFEAIELEVGRLFPPGLRGDLSHVPAAVARRAVEAVPEIDGPVKPAQRVRAAVGAGHEASARVELRAAERRAADDAAIGVELYDEDVGLPSLV